MISESIRKVSNPDNIKCSFIICGLHCFHLDQKHQGGNLALTFNERLKSNFFSVPNLNEKLILNPQKSNSNSSITCVAND